MDKINIIWLLAIAFAATLAAADADMAITTRRLDAAERRTLDSRMGGNRRQREERHVREDDSTQRQRSMDARRSAEDFRRSVARLSDEGSNRRMAGMERRDAIAVSSRRLMERDARTVAERRDLAALDTRRINDRDSDNRRVREEYASRRTDIVVNARSYMDTGRRTVERIELATERRSRQTDASRRRNGPTSMAIDDASRRRDLREKDLTRTDDRMGNLGYARAMNITDEQGNGGWSNVVASGSLAMFAVIYYMQKANDKQRRNSFKCE